MVAGIWYCGVTTLSDNFASSERDQRIHYVFGAFLQHLRKLILEVNISESWEIVHQLISDKT
jgi:hypothetical protein